jgi:hypothetical protein
MSGQYYKIAAVARISMGLFIAEEQTGGHGAIKRGMGVQNEDPDERGT